MIFAGGFIPPVMGKLHIVGIDQPVFRADFVDINRDIAEGAIKTQGQLAFIGVAVYDVAAVDRDIFAVMFIHNALGDLVESADFFPEGGVFNVLALGQ